MFIETRCMEWQQETNVHKKKAKLIRQMHMPTNKYLDGHACTKRNPLTRNKQKTIR